MRMKTMLNKYIKRFGVLLWISLSYQYNLKAFDAINLFGRWGVFQYYANSEGGDFDSPGTVTITSEAKRHYYFYEDGNGKYIIPTSKRGKVVLNFTWSISNDTLNIVQGDTIVRYVIDKVEDTNRVRQLYLRLLGKNDSKWFSSSFIAVSDFTKFTPMSDFIKEDSIKSVVIDSDIIKTIDEYKKYRQIDEILIGYQDAEKKYHYTFFDTPNRSTQGIFGNTDEWEKNIKCVCFIMYEQNTNKILSMYYMKYNYDEYMPDRIVFDCYKLYDIYSIKE